MLKRRLFKSFESKIFFTIWIIYLFYASHYGGSYMADSMLQLTQAFVDNGDIIINDYIKPSCKETGCDYSFYKGNWYSGFFPGPSILAIPVYFVFKPFLGFIPEGFLNRPKVQIDTIALNVLGTVFVTSVLGALLGVIIYKFSGYFLHDNKKRILLAFLFAFGTIFFKYSTEYSARVVSGFCIFLSFYLLFKNKHETVNETSLFFSGFLSGFAILSEPFLLTFVFVLTLYLLSFLRNKKTIYFFLGLGIPLIILFIYNYVAFESVLKNSYNYRAYKVDEEIFKTGFMGFLYPGFEKLWWYTFSARYGIFFYMPIFLLALSGGVYWFRNLKKYLPEFFTIIAIVILNYLFVTALQSESPQTFGPRYLMPCLPFLFLFISAALNKTRNFILYLLGGLSVFINYIATMYIIERAGEYAGIHIMVNLLKEIPKKGFTNYTFNLINQEVFKLNYLLVNLVNIVILSLIGVIIWKIWHYKTEMNEKTNIVTEYPKH